MEKNKEHKFILNNGIEIKLVEIDFWSRPVFKLNYKEKDYRLVLVDNELHLMMGEEPYFPVKDELQLRDAVYNFHEGTFSFKK